MIQTKKSMVYRYYRRPDGRRALETARRLIESGRIKPDEIIEISRNVQHQTMVSPFYPHSDGTTSVYRILLVLLRQRAA